MKKKVTNTEKDDTSKIKSKIPTMEAILQEKKRELQLDEAFELSNAASFTDCTGSIPSAPLNTDQWENYDEAYHFQPTPVKSQKK